MGFAIAQRLAKHGVKLILIDIDDKGLDRIRGKFPSGTLFFNTDITSEAQVSDMVNKLSDQTEKVDILINSAGITGQTNIQSHQVDTADLQRVFDVNFKGSWLTSKYLIPGMLEQGYGRILHIASIAGKEGNAGMLAYSASKAAVSHLTRVLAVECAGDGVLVKEGLGV